MVPRVRGNKSRSRKLGLTLKEIQDVVQFIMNYAGVWRVGRGKVWECEGERQCVKVHVHSTTCTYTWASVLYTYMYTIHWV